MSFQFRHRRLPKKLFFNWCHRFKIFLNRQQTILRDWCYIRTFLNRTLLIRPHRFTLCLRIVKERERVTCFYIETGSIVVNIRLQSTAQYLPSTICLVYFELQRINIVIPKSVALKIMKSVRITAPLCTVSISC